MKEKKIKNNENDRMLLLISVVFAIFLWLYARSEIDPERTITIRDVNVRFENIAEIKANNLEIISPKEAKVNVKIKGNQSNISKLNKDSVSASVNLAGYYAGDYKIPIKVSVDVTNMVVESRSPETINFKIEEIVSRDIGVNLITKGSVADNYVLGNIKQEETVTVTGAKSYIDKIERVSAVFDVDGKWESTVLTSKINAYDKDSNVINEVSFSPETIDLEVPILKTQILPVRLNITGEMPEGMDTKDFSVEPNSVTIKGNSVVVNKIKEISTELVNVNDLIDKQKPVEILLPDGISLVDKDIKFVASAQPITIPRQKITIKNEDIDIKNAPEDYNVEIIETDELEFEVTPKNPISNKKLYKNSIVAFIDLAGLEEGEHDVKLDIEIPSEFRFLSKDPLYVKVKLHKKGIFDR
ncbi:putative membrane protein [Peptoniphilus sp. ING2-D1G]|nr:putative membrane protein [Peptoniphilus sp. ING2-D1G]